MGNPELGKVGAQKRGNLGLNLRPVDVRRVLPLEVDEERDDLALGLRRLKNMHFLIRYDLSLSLSLSLSSISIPT